MNSQDFEMYPCNLVEFVEKFVAHNSTVYLYSKEICYDYIANDTPYKLRYSKWILLWSGMDWEITDTEYIASKDALLRCPFWNAKVIGICPVMKEDRRFDDSVDEVGIIIDEKSNMLN